MICYIEFAGAFKLHFIHLLHILHVQSWKGSTSILPYSNSTLSSLYHLHVCKIQCFKTKGFPSHFTNFKNNRPCSFLPWVQSSMLFPLFWFRAPTLKNIHIGKHINVSGLSSPNAVVISKMVGCQSLEVANIGAQFDRKCEVWASPSRVTCQLISAID